MNKVCLFPRKDNIFSSKCTRFRVIFAAWRNIREKFVYLQNILCYRIIY